MNYSGTRKRRHSDAEEDEDQIEKEIKEVREAALHSFLTADKFVSGLLAFIVQFRKVQVEIFSNAVKASIIESSIIKACLRSFGECIILLNNCIM